jgi:hypothetical protein
MVLLREYPIMIWRKIFLELVGNSIGEGFLRLSNCKQIIFSRVKIFDNHTITPISHSATKLMQHKKAMA